MNNNEKQDYCISGIDYYQLMDLRIDYAFKLLFTKGDTRLLISLLNAIFLNKKISRVIKSLTIKNPHFEKESVEDKLSILDIRAELEDGTTVLIEMHMYGLGDLKAKTIRSWSRAYGEELEAGQSYAQQPPTIAIAFTNGNIDPTAVANKIHRLYKIMDCEDFTVFTDAMELHYIDMKTFATAVNEAGSISINSTDEILFSKWLSVITQKEIDNKAIIADACKDEEDIQMAVATLARQGEDKYARQAYQRRKDEIYFYNMRMQQAEREKQRAEQEKQRAEQEKQRAEQERQRAEQEKQRADRLQEEVETLRQQLATLQPDQSQQ